MAAHDHEVVSIYGYSEAQIDKLMTHAHECVLMWSTKDGWPVGVVHAFVWRDGRVWMTFAAHRHRAAAIRRDNRVSVTVSGAGASHSDCPRGAATLKGRGYFHEDEDTKKWFYQALSEKINPHSKEGQDHFYSILDSPLRVILEVVPEKWITFDADKSARDLAGTLSEDEKTPRLNSDSERMAKERERRRLGVR